jgi:predicted  nucleic acid-binding Zn-ribbon protein
MVAYCNRCNEQKTSNGPCPKCGCPEFRIEKHERNQDANQKGLQPQDDQQQHQD